jgi:hypothetical protein
LNFMMRTKGASHRGTETRGKANHQGNHMDFPPRLKS